MEEIIVRYQKPWNFERRRKKHGRLLKTMKLSFSMKKTMLIYRNN